MQIDLHVSRAGAIIPKAQKRPAKIRSGFAVPKAWMEHLNRTAIGRLEIFPHDSLVKPNRLKQLLRRHRNIFAQFSQTAPPPLCIEVDPRTEHDDLLFRIRGLKVKSRVFRALLSNGRDGLANKSPNVSPHWPLPHDLI